MQQQQALNAKAAEANAREQVFTGCMAQRGWTLQQVQATSAAPSSSASSATQARPEVQSNSVSSEATGTNYLGQSAAYSNSAERLAKEFTWCGSPTVKFRVKSMGVEFFDVDCGGPYHMEIQCAAQGCSKTK